MAQRHARLGRVISWTLTGLGLVGWVAALRWMPQTAFDAHAYYVGQYGAGVGNEDAYLYSPAFTQFVEPLRWLGWDSFRTAFRLAVALPVVYFTGPLSLPLLFVDPILLEMRSGNIHLLLSAAALAGSRWPAAWSFVLLTKVTPGIGLVWFVVRREWRQLSTALLVTAAIALLSYALAPAAWWEWLSLMAAQRPPAEVGGVPPWLTDVPLPARLLAAACLVGFGARHTWRWTLVVGAYLALPVIWGNSIIMLLAVLPAAFGSEWWWSAFGERRTSMRTREPS